VHRTTAACVAALLLATGTACSSNNNPTVRATDTPVIHSRAACKAAIKAQYVPGTARLKGKPHRPEQCADVSNDGLSTIVMNVIAENTG
jgi:hypothetical protein